MKRMIKTICMGSLFVVLTNSSVYARRHHPKQSVPPTHHDATPKIQAAILLDVSNSMDGLIEQAKLQLWNMVSILGKVSCNQVAPKIEIALYEYGRPANGVQSGYVRQLSGFTTDLDQLSKTLFGLRTNGGEEYCGHVIFSSLNELKWDADPKSYKVIFIAGNEDFLQGDILYSKSCTLAKEKGVIVNTIYCGDRMQGIREHWNLGGACNDGSFTNINQDAKPAEMPTPYDSNLVALNMELNKTYIAYGSTGYASQQLQGKVDGLQCVVVGAKGIRRISVKAKKQLYNNANWDLVDKAAEDKEVIKHLDKSTLTDSLRNKSDEELKRIVDSNTKARLLIQEQINTISIQRDRFLQNEKEKSSHAPDGKTLETEIERIIREQLKRFNMVVL